MKTALLMVRVWIKTFSFHFVESSMKVWNKYIGRPTRLIEIQSYAFQINLTECKKFTFSSSPFMLHPANEWKMDNRISQAFK